MFRNFIFLVFVSVVLPGCGSGKTLVMEPSIVKTSATSINIVEGESTVKIPKEVIDKFHSKLAQLLFDENKFDRGSEVTITYRFLQYDEGNQLARWFWGGIGNAGEGSITIEAVYTDSSNNRLAKIQSEGKIGSGFFGGDFSLAIEKAAEEISVYTINNFK